MENGRNIRGRSAAVSVEWSPRQVNGRARDRLHACTARGRLVSSRHHLGRLWPNVGQLATVRPHSVNDIVTIGIPVYNRTTYFQQALESALHQSVPTRVVVVDNASDRVDFQAVLAPYARPGLSFQRNATNLGMGGNWNECLRLCQTPYLLILHDDDFLERDYVEQFLRLRQGEPALAWCHVGIVDGAGRVTSEQLVPDMQVFAEPLDWCFQHPIRAGAIFHVATAVGLGGFRKDLKFTLDWDLWFRLLMAGARQFLPVRGAWYRDYTDVDRGTSQLMASPKLTLYRRNQTKRNFHRLGPSARYRDYLHSGRIPGVSLPEVLAFWPNLSARQRRYFARLCVLTPSITRGGKWVRSLIGWFGPPAVTLLRPMLLRK